MDYESLIEVSKSLVSSVFTNAAKHYPYHNLGHTKRVVNYSDEIGKFYSLDKMDNCCLLVASWFHDIGHVSGEMKDHELRSSLTMNKYLTRVDIPIQFIGNVAKCIMATKMDFTPLTLLEKIIRDADAYHFGTSYFRETELLIKAEMEMRTGKTFQNWHAGTLQLLEKHVFYTDYCQRLLNKGKQENIDWLQSCCL